ncbi:MAG TPA: ice-binding family protein [Rubricoccaceae bacterium]
MALTAAMALGLPFAASAQVGPAPVNLRTAGNYVVLAKTGISSVPPSVITGDLGVSPAAATYITGFSLVDNTGYASSPQVTGRVYAADMEDPTPSNLTAAVSDMETAFTDAAGRPSPDFTELYDGNVGGRTLAPGLYRWSGTVSAPTNFEVAGGPDDVWIFQIAGDLSVSSDVLVALSGGARSRNIFWQVSGGVTAGTDSHLEGVVLSMTAITMQTGASLNGRALSQTAVTFDQNTVTEPAVSTGTDDGGLAGGLALTGNSPNPFASATRIGFTLPAPSEVRLAVYDMLGREVAVLASGTRGAGPHEVSWDARSAPNGMYVYHLSAGGEVRTGRMTVLK